MLNYFLINSTNLRLEKSGLDRATKRSAFPLREEMGVLLLNQQWKNPEFRNFCLMRFIVPSDAFVSQFRFTICHDIAH